MAMQAKWTGGNGDAAAYCVKQYNRVYERLKTHEPDLEMLFDPLDADSSLTVVAMASRQLVAYFDDELGRRHDWGPVYAAACDADSFKDFWHKSAEQIEELGEVIRESMEQWADQNRKRKHRKPNHDADETE